MSRRFYRYAYFAYWFSSHGAKRFVARAFISRIDFSKVSKIEGVPDHHMWGIAGADPRISPRGAQKSVSGSCLSDFLDPDHKTKRGHDLSVLVACRVMASIGTSLPPRTLA